MFGRSVIERAPSHPFSPVVHSSHMEERETSLGLSFTQSKTQSWMSDAVSVALDAVSVPLGAVLIRHAVTTVLYMVLGDAGLEMRYKCD
jgi:hypothetical protein